MPSKFLNLSTDDTLGGNSPSNDVAVSQKAIKKYVDDHGGGGGSVSIDNKSITKNTNNELQTTGVINQNNTSTAIKTWTGTKAQYDAIVSGGTVDSNTLYNTDNGLFLGTTQIANLSSVRNIGEIIQSTIPLTDAGLHLLDGALISGSGSYADFVTYISGLVSTYPDLFETEANWQSSVSTYGVCGKWVYDSVNKTVRLPKITGFTESTINPTTLGDLTQAGLPNITGEWGSSVVRPNSLNIQTGVFSNKTTRQTTYYNNATANTTTSEYWGLSFDASAGNSIYGNSTTVQPQSIKLLYYVCIATATKTQIEVDIDEVITDLNGKADVDLSNVNNLGTSKGAGWAMPSGTYENLTMGASGATYSAPANGWFTIDGTGSGSHFQMINLTSSLTATYTYVQNVYAARGFLPAKKNDLVQINHNSGVPNGGYFRFIYAEGEV